MYVYPTRYNQRSLGQLRGLSDVDWTPIVVVAGIGGAFALVYVSLGLLVRGADAVGFSGPPTKGWAKQAPKKMSTRKKMPRSCFLDQKNRKYPVCAKSTRGRQRVSCKGTLAAYSRARQQKKNSLANKAVRLAKRNGCSWAAAH